MDKGVIGGSKRSLRGLEGACEVSNGPHGIDRAHKAPKWPEVSVGEMHPLAT